MYLESSHQKIETRKKVKINDFNKVNTIKLVYLLFD